MAERLPIDAHLPELLCQLRHSGAVVVVAEPGAGKTTRVPPALLFEGLYPQGEILVLQPRRIACRLSAQRVAQELGEAVGERVGYQVRFEKSVGPATRVLFITEGILTRRLSSRQGLRGVAAVVLDEFHERSVHADYALAAVQRLRRSTRPDLALLVMSATLDAEPVAAFIGCGVVRVPGRTFPVQITHHPAARDTPVEKQVASALRQVLENPADPQAGDVLVFLPGAAEIRRTAQTCTPLCARGGRELHMLHGDLPSREQEKAVKPGSRPKVILSTNIAETSLTLPNVTVVIDSGLCRVAGHSPFSGLPALTTAPISQASAIQRAGRAGRVGPGRCLRLYSEHDLRTRPTHDRPELARADLCELCLNLAASGEPWPADAWLLPPPDKAWERAYQLLVELGALAAPSPEAARLPPLGRPLALTAMGKRMLGIPLHPRLSRLLLEAEARGVGQLGAAAAAVLSERDLLSTGRAYFSAFQHDVMVGRSDVLARIELLERLVAGRFDPGLLRSEQADGAAARRVARAVPQLVRLLQDKGLALADGADEEALGLAVLAAFPDRVAKRRQPGGSEVVFARGGAAALPETSEVREAAFLVVVDATTPAGRSSLPRARLASAIEPEWLLELFPDQVEDRTEIRFDPQHGRVDAVHSLRFGSLVLDESRTEPEPEAAAAALFESVCELGLDKVFDVEVAERFFSRWRQASRSGQVQGPPEQALTALCQLACADARSLDDLRHRRLDDYLPMLLSGAQLAAIEQYAPTYVTLPSGRRLIVHYECGKPPHVAARLQDFFGMTEAPRLGTEPLVLHLLAPNQRAVQVTSDLSGFWDRHYPELRKALMRRYPKHAFPEDPRTAEPPAPRRPRRS